MIDPPAVPLTPGWHDDPESPTRLRYFDGAAWTDRTSPKASSTADSELEDTVNDALSEGFNVQSRVGDTVVVTRRLGVSGLSVFIYLLLIIFLFPIGLLFIIPWVNEAKRQTRFSIRRLPNGTVEQTRLDYDPRAIRATGTRYIVFGVIFAAIGFIAWFGVSGGWIIGLPLAVVGVALILSGVQKRGTVPA